MKKILAIDFDETIANRSEKIHSEGYRNTLTTVIPGAKEFIDSMKDKYTIIIFSARTDTTLLYVNEKMYDMVFFLTEHKIYYDEVALPACGKVYADYYIDDKAIRFENNWDEIKYFIESRES